jgi:hypothetical protein
MACEFARSPDNAFASAVPIGLDSCRWRCGCTSGRRRSVRIDLD